MGKKTPKAVFLSDSLSALQSLTSETPDDSQKKLMDNINELAKSTKVVLQWIPAHTGIAGNEITDQLAKEGRKKSAFLTSVIQRNKNSDPIWAKTPLSLLQLVDTIHKMILSTNCLTRSKQQSFV